MGESERRKPEDAPVMSGPFSLGQVQQDSSARRRAPAWAARSGGGGGGGGGSGGGGTGGGGGGIKTEPGRGAISDVTMADQPYIKSEEGGYISSDDDEEADKGKEKRNVDELTFVDLTLDDEESGDMPNRSTMAPVRVQRVEHKDRTIGLNADGVASVDGSAAAAQSHDVPSTSDKKKGKHKARDVEIVREQHKYRGVYSESSSEQELEPQIKPEPTSDDDRPATPEPAAGEAVPKSPQSSPEARRKAKERIKAVGDANEKPSFQTNEEATEYDLHQRDLRMLRDELGHLATPPVSTDGDANMANTEQPQAYDPRADKVYLFQFPPILPDLTPQIIKPDPDAPPPPGPPAAAPMVPSDPPPPPAEEEPVEVPDSSSGPGKATHSFASGRVGKLRIHKSGRATLDWGGTPLEVGMGTEASFLQDVIIADLKRERREEGKEEQVVGGTAVGMGQVKGKFVVTPDWGKILG